MKTSLLIISIIILSSCEKQQQMQSSKNNQTPKQDQYNKLSKEEQQIIINKKTEPPFSGKYNNFSQYGIYQCKQCNAPLYKSEHKFPSKCGWPSFDDQIPQAITQKLDADHKRIEIICSKCQAHLGHIFVGEHLTTKNTRHCVNSLSLKFVPIPLSYAYFAGGCFWGMQYQFQKLSGVISIQTGYMGGKIKNPTYKQVCSKNTGHIETIQITYDPKKISYKQLTKYFFEIHDPTQIDGQGPDIGQQYQSAIFYNNKQEKQIAQQLINILQKKNCHVVTKLIPKTNFYKAEEYHQNYYNKHHKKPYCHTYQKKF